MLVGDTYKHLMDTTGFEPVSFLLDHPNQGNYVGVSPPYIIEICAQSRPKRLLPTKGDGYGAINQQLGEVHLRTDCSYLDP
jgi:hypothetical protein